MGKNNSSISNRARIQARADKMYDCALAIKKSQENPGNKEYKGIMKGLQSEVADLPLDMYDKATDI